MKQLSYISTIFTLICLSSFIYAMELNTFPESTPMSAESLSEYQQAEQYNDTECLLTRLPNEKLLEIFSYCLADDPDQVMSLEKSIKNFMQLSMVCKNFNRLLMPKIVGEFCKGYNQYYKNEALKILYNREDKAPVALILIYAGATPNILLRNGVSLLRHAVILKNIPLITTLLAHNANPNFRDPSGDPILYYASKEIAQMLIDKGADITIGTKCYNNIIWCLIGFYYTANLVDFYLQKGVDPRGLAPFDSSCLFHTLALPHDLTIDDNHLMKAELLLNVIPDMINTVNIVDQTPIDHACRAQKYSKTPEVFEKLIALYKKHGGKTAKEIREAPMLILLHKADHLGDLSILPDDVRKYIVQYMMHLNK